MEPDKYFFRPEDLLPVVFLFEGGGVFGETDLGLKGTGFAADSHGC